MSRLFLLSVLLLAACGQKGPLYLPAKAPEQPAASVPEAVMPATAEIQATTPVAKDKAATANQP
jgi:predicted small lipoprotein YifL